MAVVYKHREKITMPVLHVFQSNAIRLKPGVLYDSISLCKINDDNTVGEKIECYEYDVESRVLFLPDYSFEDKVFIKYDREVEAMTGHSDSFTDKCESIFKLSKDDGGRIYK